MKIFFLVLLFPLASLGQTAHVSDEEVKYEGTTRVAGMSAGDIYDRAVAILPGLLYSADIHSNGNDRSIYGKVEMKLPTPYQQIRKAFFNFHLTAMDGGYEYKVDSLSVMDQRRGGTQHFRTSKEVIESIEQGGATAITTEIILNQIDMKIHEILARLQTGIQAAR